MKSSGRFAGRLLAALALACAAASPSAGQSAQDHQYTSADIEAGARIYSGQCSLCHGPNGDAVSGIDLRRGRFRRVVSDEDVARVIRTGVSESGMPSFASLRAEDINALVAFIRAGFDVNGEAVKIGNPSRGQTLFAGKGACATCHRVNGVGPRMAPDLSDIGAIRAPSVLQRSLLNPTSAMLPINRPVRIVTKDNTTIQGRRLNEDTYTVQIIDSRDRLLTFVKKDLKEYEVSARSTMPPATQLSSDELSDLIAYLLTLKGMP